MRRYRPFQPTTAAGTIPARSLGIGAFGTIVDGYPLDRGKAAPGKMTLIMDLYRSEHAEDRAPPGFTIAPR